MKYQVLFSLKKNLFKNVVCRNRDLALLRLIQYFGF